MAVSVAVAVAVVVAVAVWVDECVAVYASTRTHNLPRVAMGMRVCLCSQEPARQVFLGSTGHGVGDFLFFAAGDRWCIAAHAGCVLHVQRWHLPLRIGGSHPAGDPGVTGR